VRDERHGYLERSSEGFPHENSTRHVSHLSNSEDDSDTTRPSRLLAGRAPG
jgi:hypothetical protein